jgi:hypothetical protein
MKKVPGSVPPRNPKQAQSKGQGRVQRQAERMIKQRTKK